MHTLHVDGGYLVVHNGDFSGDVMIRTPKGSAHHEEGAEHWIPFHVLEAVVAEKIRADKIAVLEQAEAGELLGCG